MPSILERNKLYYSISELTSFFGVPASTLRFWEQEFPKLNPKKGKSGSRQYSARDVQYIEQIVYLTKTCNYTLEGARNKMDKSGTDVLDRKTEALKRLTELREKLVALRDVVGERLKNQL